MFCFISPHFQRRYWSTFIPCLSDQSEGQLPRKDITDDVCSSPDALLVSDDDEVERPARAELQERLQLASWLGLITEVDQDTTESKVCWRRLQLERIFKLTRKYFGQRLHQLRLFPSQSPT